MLIALIVFAVIETSLILALVIGNVTRKQEVLTSREQALGVALIRANEQIKISDDLTRMAEIDIQALRELYNEQRAENNTLTLALDYSNVTFEYLLDALDKAHDENNALSDELVECDILHDLKEED